MRTLPNLPSDLIIVAMGDLVAAEMSNKYIIKMGVWHDADDEDISNACAVCLAGSVMAMSLGAKLKETVSPYNFYKIPGAKDKLLALNEFRIGSVEFSFDLMGIDGAPDKVLRDREIALYENDPVEFKSDMLKMAAFLARNGY